MSRGYIGIIEGGEILGYVGTMEKRWKLLLRVKDFGFRVSGLGLGVSNIRDLF